MLEAGQVRSKNVSSQLTKNLLTWSVGVSVFFVIGAGVASLAGGGGFAPAFDAGPTGWSDWLYGAVFPMTAATIGSGAVAGRAKLRAYVAYTFLLAAVIYPMVIAFTWTGAGITGTGLVEDITGTAFTDFAGGMIVHGMGGIAGLTAAAVLGARMGRYNDDGSANVIPGHSMTFAVLGTLMLAFGWYGFNVGTSAITDGSGAFLGDRPGRVAMTTTIAMASGAMGASAVAWAKTGKVDTLYVANGLLGTLLYSFVAVDAWSGFSPDVAFMLEGVVAQALGVFLIGGWTLTMTALIWVVFRLVGQARVTPEHESEGLDVSEHGVETYPEFGDEGTAVTDGGAVRGVSVDGTMTVGNKEHSDGSGRNSE